MRARERERGRERERKRDSERERETVRERENRMPKHDMKGNDLEGIHPKMWG